MKIPSLPFLLPPPLILSLSSPLSQISERKRNLILFVTSINVISEKK